MVRQRRRYCQMGDGLMLVLTVQGPGGEKAAVWHHKMQGDPGWPNPGQLAANDQNLLMGIAAVIDSQKAHWQAEGWTFVRCADVFRSLDVFTVELDHVPASAWPWLQKQAQLQGERGRYHE